MDKQAICQVEGETVRQMDEQTIIVKGLHHPPDDIANPK